MGIAERVLGPKVPGELLESDRARYRRPTAMFVVAAVLLVISIFVPYWRLHLWAPQFPAGLTIDAYVNRLEGDVDQLEGLNHYVGMESFEHGAVFERSIAVAGIVAMAGLILAGAYIRSRWVVLFVLPGLLFPLIFMGDLQWWLWRYGHELDPLAPFAAAVGKFTPPLFGPAEIAQFETKALPGPGLILSVVASVVIGVGLWWHRQAYKPLVEATEETGKAQ